MRTLEEAGLGPRSQSVDFSHATAREAVNVSVSTRASSFSAVTLMSGARAAAASGTRRHLAAGGAAVADDGDSSDEPDAMPQLMYDETEPSYPGSVRSAADLSQEPSATEEASASSQQLLPNLLLTEQELASRELSRASSTACLKDPNPSSRSNGTLRIQVSAGSSSGIVGGPPLSPVVKALFTDALLPATPKTCSHSNLRVLASRNSIDWQRGPGAASTNSRSSSDGSCSSSNRPPHGAYGSLDDSCWEISAGQSGRPESGASAASSGACRIKSGGLGASSGHSFSGSKLQNTSGSSHDGAGGSGGRSVVCASAAAAAAGPGGEDEEALMADMDVCLGSLLVRL